jgi:hypothetical protein
MSQQPFDSSPEHRSQAGASAISWWQKNADNISVFTTSSKPQPSGPPQPVPSFPPKRITIPVQVHATAAPQESIQQPTAGPFSTNPSSPPPPSKTSGGSSDLIDLLSNDDVYRGRTAPPTTHTHNAQGGTTAPPLQFAQGGTTVPPPNSLPLPPNLHLELHPPLYPTVLRQQHHPLLPPTFTNGAPLLPLFNLTTIITYSPLSNNTVISYLI